MITDDRIERARLIYEHAVFGGDAGALTTAEQELDAVEADLALARGRILHARFIAQRAEGLDATEDSDELALFQRAAHLYQSLGDVRGEGEALFWVGSFHQVVRQDNDSAVPSLKKSYELAAQAGDKLTMSYALRHLSSGEYAAGRVDTAREWLEDSVRLRREIGFAPGVAANLHSLARIAAEQGERHKAVALLDEAGAIAAACGAQGVMRFIEQAREEL